jgi:hypothetical protein
MVYYCGICKSKLVSQKIKIGEHSTGTTKKISYKVFLVQKTSRYVCPNGCVLESVSESKPVNHK